MLVAGYGTVTVAPVWSVIVFDVGAGVGVAVGVAVGVGVAQPATAIINMVIIANKQNTLRFLSLVRTTS
jgi:hypothetical protein